jgi:hypothetical protein
MLQKARAEPTWFSAQEGKLKAFVCGTDLKALTLANLTKGQATLVSALAEQYGLTVRPMPMLLSKHRLQMLKGPRSAMPEPQLVPYAKTLTTQDFMKLQAQEAASTFAMQYAPLTH